MTTSSFANPFRPYNPFIATIEEPAIVELEEVAETGDVSYALVQNGPAVPADEVESHLDAVEVKVTWGTQVLSVKHLETGTGFSIGEGADFEVPNLLNSEIVSYRGGMTVVSIPAGASATVFARGESPRGVMGGDEIDLRDGMRVSIAVDPVVIEVAAVRAGKKLKVGFLASLATGAAAAIGLSFVGHTAIVASLALFMPKMNADDAESISRDQMLTMQTLMNASADREQEKTQEESTATDEAGGGATGGEPHKGEAGVAGTTASTNKATPMHMAFHGSDDHVQLSRSEEKELAGNFGLVGMLKSGINPTSMNSPWGADSQLGMDRDNKMGSLFGENAGDMFGYGVGVSGAGEGGGGNGTGIGIDGVGNTVGGGGGGPGKWGYGKGDKGGIGDGHSPVGGGHVARAPKFREAGPTTVNGRLPAEVIQRIVRQNGGRFRMCYEAGLRGNPTLTGRVTTKFIIGRDGAVSQAVDSGSDMPNQEVISCVVRSFTSLSFPPPQGGVATVVYPIVLTPAE